MGLGNKAEYECRVKQSMGGYGGGDMNQIGEITSVKKGCFKWNIESFREVYRKYDRWISPSFTYSNLKLFLVLRRGDNKNIVTFLFVGSHPNSHYVKFQLCTEYNIVSELHSTTMRPETTATAFNVFFGEFLSDDYTTPLHDRLTVLLRVRELKSSDMFPDEFWSDKASVKETSDEEKTNSKIIKKMRNDFKSLLVSGGNSDVTLVVGGKKYPAHRNILCARSPVFKSMLCHDTMERDSGTVNIDDCDPDKFLDFLFYVYTGSTRHINDGNVISLYTTSDKYLMGELKEACVFFMKANITVEGFCGIAILALWHEEKELLESLTNFFCENAKEISETENWVTFFKDNPNDAYEHFMKPSINRI